MLFKVSWERWWHDEYAISDYVIQALYCWACSHLERSYTSKEIWNKEFVVAFILHVIYSSCVYSWSLFNLAIMQWHQLIAHLKHHNLSGFFQGVGVTTRILKLNYFHGAVQWLSVVSVIFSHVQNCDFLTSADPPVPGKQEKPAKLTQEKERH